MGSQSQAREIKVDPWVFEPNRIAAGWQIGSTLVLSGAVSVGPDGEVIGAGDFDAQAQQVIRNIETILTAAGSRLDNIVKVTIYLTDAAYWPNIIELRGRCFNPPYPASTMIVVSGLALPELMVEIEAIAVTDEAMGSA